MKLNKQIISSLLSMIPRTHEDEIGCDDCFDELHRFAELELKGKSPEKAMPLIREHLDNCGECRQEYQALLEGIRALEK